MPKKCDNNVNVRQTYPIFGEVNPQRVVQLIEQFHELLPLRGREDCVSVRIIDGTASSKLRTGASSRSFVSLSLPGKEGAAVCDWTWLPVDTI